MLMTEVGSSVTIGTVSVIAAVLTAGATWCANGLVGGERRREKKLKIDNLRNEISSFAQWYVKARPALLRLQDLSCEGKATKEVLEDHKRNIVAFNENFNYWNDHKVEILTLLKCRYKYGKDMPEKCKILVKNMISFNRLYMNVKSLMENQNYEKLPFNEFCDQFINLCPTDLVSEWGGENKNFNSCLRNKMDLLEKYYEEVGGKLGLDPLTLK